MLTTVTTPHFMSVQQAAERVGISHTLIYEALQSGELAAARFGRAGRRGTWRIDAADLIDWFSRCKQLERNATDAQNTAPTAPA